MILKMKKTLYLLSGALAFLLFSCQKDKYAKLPDGLYAEITTNKGVIICELEYNKTPITVANFITLAEGKNSFVSSEYKSKKLFDGLKFHRVIPNFMIQGGDPLGNGSGDAGYKFKDEITDLKFDTGGLLAMANSGPGTNSSQFFITHIATPWLDGKHTIFGHVVDKGMDVVNSVVQDDAINSVKIIRKGVSANKFDAIKTFDDYFKIEAENQNKQAAIEAENQKKYQAQFAKIISDKLAFFAASKASSIKSATGLQYKILKKAGATKPAVGTNVMVKYSGFLENGTLFDTSDEAVAKQFGKYDAQRAAQMGYQNIPFAIGKKDGLIPGFIEGLEKINPGDKIIIFIPSNLGYGENGAGNVIPPNANIIFEVEMVK